MHVAVNSTFLGAVTITGQEAKAFARKVTHARGTKAASESAMHGRPLASTFAKKGVVTVNLARYNSSKSR